MIGKKPTRLSLEEMWDLEEQFTAVVGRPTGAKITLPAVPPVQVQSDGALSKASGESQAITRDKDSAAGEVRRKVAPGELSCAGKTKSKI